jgi:hypothetical protein
VGIKEKIRNTVEDFQIQAKKDQQKIAEYKKERSMLKMERAMMLKKVEETKKKDAWNEKALSRLEEANLTVKKLAKLDVPGRIRTDTIDKFLEKGHANYKPIFDTLSKFTADVEEALDEFKKSIHPLTGIVEDLHRELRDRKREAKLQDDGDCSAQGKRKRKEVIPSNTKGEFSEPEEGRNPEKSLGKPEKKKSPVKVKLEIDKDMQEAQGPDTTMREQDQEKTSSKPSPTE